MFIHNYFVMFTTISSIKLHQFTVPHTLIPSTKKAAAKVCARPSARSSFFLFLSSGVYCNSPSACFVASDGHSLRMYQAVIEAKKLLSELSNPEISVSYEIGFSNSAGCRRHHSDFSFSLNYQKPQFSVSLGSLKSQ